MKPRRVRSGGSTKPITTAPHTFRNRHAKLARLDAEARAEAMRVRLHGLPVEDLEPVPIRQPKPAPVQEPDDLDLDHEPFWYGL